MQQEPTHLVREIKLADSEVAFYKKYGYLYIPNFVESSQIPALREDIFRTVELCTGFSHERLDHATEAGDKLRPCSDYEKGSPTDQMINSERGMALASRLIGGSAMRFRPFSAIKSGGGGGTFDFHQDNNYTQHDPVEGSLNIWVALVDMSPENGCLQMAPESHHAGIAESTYSDDGDSHRKVTTDPENIFHVRMRAGDAIAFSRLTIHGSGPNHTDQARVAYALQYSREDVSFLDTETDTWKPLIDKSRFQPLESLENLDENRER